MKAQFAWLLLTAWGISGCDAPSEPPTDRSGPRPAPSLGASAGVAAAESAAVDAGPAPEEDRVAYARSLISKFGPRLKQELMQGMAAGGPVNAVAVCNEKAPSIGEGISMAPGWSIGRTSLKLRNPKNAPDAWELAMLKKLEEEKAAGKPLAELEVSETVGGEFRYLKAIGTDAMCLTCHGAELPNDLTAALDAKYPDDKARGYAAGEIRGAFTVRNKL